MILGAIIGDIAGSRFEFDTGPKSKNFELLHKNCFFTDDTVLTIAIMNALSMYHGYENLEVLAKKELHRWGNKYIDAGYGGSFYRWLQDNRMKPYNSYGNGSAMRISPVGWYFDTLEETIWAADECTKITHNHPEGMKGAECTASVIFLARQGKTKEEIKKYVESTFKYDLSESLDELRKRHEHLESCQDSLPKALTSFFEGNDFVDVIKNAISLGGDTDTIGAIAGSMAEAMYEIPQDIYNKTFDYLPEDIMYVLRNFRAK